MKPTIPPSPFAGPQDAGLTVITKIDRDPSSENGRDADRDDKRINEWSGGNASRPPGLLSLEESHYRRPEDASEFTNGDKARLDLVTNPLDRLRSVTDSRNLPSEERLTHIVEMMREMSTQTDPQQMVRDYGQRMRSLMPADHFLSISRRGLDYPEYRITRSSRWKETVNPWEEKHRLPLFQGGILALLIYGDQPKIIHDLGNIPEDDPAREYLEGLRSLCAIPNYDQGQALNMVIIGRTEPDAFDPESFPEMVWMSNLFGRATQNLVLSRQLADAYEVVDRELKTVADIQRSLLPRRLPEIPGMQLAAYYQTSRHAGGDYYDVFVLPNNRWGLFIADVSGHGTPAAVLMAVTHSLTHTYSLTSESPADLLNQLNQQLCLRYTYDTGMFVTAFYGIYDTRTRILHYSGAGHNPPRRITCRCGSVAEELDGGRGLPLGLFPEETYQEAQCQLESGDALVLYTDGITEASNKSGQLFGSKRLDYTLNHCENNARDVMDAILDALRAFVGDTEAPGDDQTLFVAKIT